MNKDDVADLQRLSVSAKRSTCFLILASGASITISRVGVRGLPTVTEAGDVGKFYRRSMMQWSLLEHFQMMAGK